MRILCGSVRGRQDRRWRCADGVACAIPTLVDVRRQENTPDSFIIRFQQALAFFIFSVINGLNTTRYATIAATILLAIAKKSSLNKPYSIRNGRLRIPATTKETNNAHPKFDVRRTLQCGQVNSFLIFHSDISPLQLGHFFIRLLSSLGTDRGHHPTLLHRIDHHTVHHYRLLQQLSGMQHPQLGRARTSA